MSQRILMAGVAIAILVALFLSSVEISVPSRPVGEIEELTSLGDRDLNVVFILVDTLRADRLSAYGYERPTSPVIDDISASGIRFATVDSQSSWTKCSMASLWTGLFPPRTGVLRFQHGIPDKATMPAEIFEQAGYKTAGIYRNGWVAPNFGFGQGFGSYIRPATRTEGPEFRKSSPGATKLPGTDLDVTVAAQEFLRSYKDQKFLLYLHYMDVHQYAYDEEAAELGFGTSLSDAYDASIHWTDRNIHGVLGVLDELELLENTLVVIASDHGEGFNEHKSEGHARTLFREVSDVPLIFMLPYRLEDELVVEPRVRNVDIWPTILDVVGLPPLADTDGISLVPLIKASARGEQIETPPSFSYIDQTWGRTQEEPEPLVAVSHGTRRMFWKPNDPGSMLLYDRSDDPWEQRNLRVDAPAWSAPLREEIDRQLAAEVPWGAADEIEIDELYRAQLRALGYVVE